MENSGGSYKAGLFTELLPGTIYGKMSVQNFRLKHTGCLLQASDVFLIQNSQKLRSCESPLTNLLPNSHRDANRKEPYHKWFS